MENTYKCVTTVDEIREYIGNAKVVSFDFETAPFDAYRTEKDAALDAVKSHIVGCSFSIEEHTGIYVPLAHRDGENANVYDFMNYLRGFLASEDIVKVAHNLYFESKFSYSLGMVINPPVYDTMAAARMSLKDDYTFRNMSDSGLKLLASELCGEPLPSYESVTDGRHFDELNAQAAETVRYAAADSDFALRLYHLFNTWFDRYMPNHRYIVENVESPTAVYIGIMQHNGIPIDYQLMLSRKEEAEAEMEKLKEDIAFIVGDVDIGSNCNTKAFRDYLYKTLKLPVMTVTEKSKEAADDKTMTMLKEWCDKNRPELSELFTLVHEYRKLGKSTSTYINGYLKYRNTATGKLHPKLFALNTETGRMSCESPNAQNMPRKALDPVGVRNFIRAPKDHLILSLDFSQIELRVGAFYCRDPKMMDTYREGGDIHAATTSVIFGVSDEEAQDKHNPNYKERRTIAKNVNFGSFYGLYPNGLQDTLKYKAKVDKTVEECAEIIANLKAGYRYLTTWQRNTIAVARKRGYTETWLGRRRYLPNIKSDSWKERSKEERRSLNTPIQGTAADILKLAMGRILCGLSERPWLKPIMQIHDELIFVIPKEKLNDAVIFVKACMEESPFPDFDLPLVAEAAAGESYGEMEELESF